MAQRSAERSAAARGLWSSLLEDREEPTAAQLAQVLAQLQIPELRDRLLADVPGLDLSMELILFGESDTAPDWDRIDTAPDWDRIDTAPDWYRIDTAEGLLLQVMF